MLDPTTAVHIAAIRGQFYANLAEIKREAGLCSEDAYRSALEERDETYCAAHAAGIAREAFVIIPERPVQLKVVPAGNGMYRLVLD
jgi:hypothetical protein